MTALEDKKTIKCNDLSQRDWKFVGAGKAIIFKFL